MSNPLKPSGQISTGPEDRLDARTVDFIREQLPLWRDDPRRSKHAAEKGLNSSLHDFLQVQAKTFLPMVYFKHEAPQEASRTVDIGAHGYEETTVIGAIAYSIYEPFLAIEAKRLPTPGGRDREREYISGFHANNSPTGGIQRFKLGLHGSKMKLAVMIGYIQQHSAEYWHTTINSWIRELSLETSRDDCIWNDSDQIQAIVANPTTRTASAQSSHQRLFKPEIQIEHLWFIMDPTIAAQ